VSVIPKLTEDIASVIQPHTGVIVSDLERSIAFYRDLLGLTLSARWIGGKGGLWGNADIQYLETAQFDIPGSAQALHLCQIHGAFQERLSGTPWNIGCAHICLFVSDVDAVVARLEVAGVMPRSRPSGGPSRAPGLKGAYVPDPDGFNIELLELTVR